ncbi:hypothetical protein V6N13_108107 [Hibiscus sabdariffa]
MWSRENRRLLLLHSWSLAATNPSLSCLCSHVCHDFGDGEYAWETSGLEIKKLNIKIADKIAACGSVGSDDERWPRCSVGKIR